MQLIKDGQLNLLRTKDSDKYYSLVNDNPLGVFLQEFQGYDFIKEVEKLGTNLFWQQADVPVAETKDYFEVSPTFPKITEEQLLQVAEFYYTYALDLRKNTEVGTMILLSEDTGKLVFAVPQQEVWYGSVNWDKLLDENRPIKLLTGEYTLLANLMVNHLFVGSCHSHNTMGLSQPSTVDDSSECGTEEDPRPLSFNLLFSCYRLDPITQMVSFVLTPTFGNKGKRIFIGRDGILDLFEDSLYPLVTDVSKEFQVEMQIPLSELEGRYDRGVLSLVTDRPVGSLRPTVPVNRFVGSRPIRTVSDFETSELVIDPKLVELINGYLITYQIDEDDFLYALAEELGVFR